MFKKTLLPLILISFTVLNAQVSVKETMRLMGSNFDITVVSKDSLTSEKMIQVAVDEITRIEKIISSWDPNSQTSNINKNAGIKPVKVSLELVNLIKRSLVISKLSDGAFDISYASMDKIWKFDGSMARFPNKEIVEKSVRKVGYENIVLNEKKQTVFLKLKGMKIGFGASGKGYAADSAKKLLQELGVTSGIINASGDMNTWGKQPNGKDWVIAITNPMNKNKTFAIFPISNKAVVTSGNYEKYVMFDGKKYTHIINPKTGYPTFGVISATVFAPSAELADALATSIFVMGYETGINRINQLPNIDCIVIDHLGKIHTSTNIDIHN